MTSGIHFTQAHYPESDGKPMGETDEHRQEMVRHIELLTDYFQGQQVYVSGNLLVYYEQGNPRKFVVPDAFVVKGVRPGKRRIYKIWVERQVPQVVIETTSRQTRRKDTFDKPQLYASLGIREYFIFDPDQEYLDPPLQGHRLTGDKYAAIAAEADGCLASEELGLRLRPENQQLQFYLPGTGERLLTRSERIERATQRAAAEAERAEAEAGRAAAEAERAAAEAGRAAAEAERAEAATRRADAEAQRAEREAAARQAAEAELARLREELARRSGN